MKLEVIAVLATVGGLSVIACGGSPAPSSPAGSNAAPQVTGSTLTAPPPEGMGVGAQRRMKNLQEKIIPDYGAELKTACGFDIPIDVDWTSFSKLHGKTCKDGSEETPCDEAALYGLGNNYSLGYVVTGVTSHCSDKIGKDAVKKKVKRIYVKAVEKSADKSIELKDGTFAVQSAWQEVAFSSAGPFFDALEKKL
jgi:hypothetical protein